MYSFTVLEKG
uniref:Uncharacterized protein n=1 Tax=Anguilla anguilla TaxID=7936 RepID=A0A0E9UBI8_ANGAN